MPTRFTTSGYLPGRMLIAMPGMADPRFSRTVVYICAHTAEGAMGIVVNREIDTLSFTDLLEQLNIEPTTRCQPIRIRFGGPVEAGRGFVLHTPDYLQDTTMLVSEQVALTATIDVLKAMAEGRGPRRSMLALGYAGWGAGQLDSEIRENAWLVSPADDDLIYDGNMDVKWEQAIHNMGINLSTLSGAAGHA